MNTIYLGKVINSVNEQQIEPFAIKKISESRTKKRTSFKRS